MQSVAENHGVESRPTCRACGCAHWRSVGGVVMCYRCGIPKGQRLASEIECECGTVRQATAKCPKCGKVPKAETGPIRVTGPKQTPREEMQPVNELKPPAKARK